MKNRTSFFAALLLGLILTLPMHARAEQPPEVIAEKMAIKFTRGLANVVTSIIELPKQSMLTVQEMGSPGYLIGPLKGAGMVLYRAFIGASEVAFFLVPQPGYYDPMINPAYVWEGWEPKREAPTSPEEPQ